MNELKVTLFWDSGKEQQFVFPEHIRGIRDAKMMRANDIEVVGEIDTEARREWFYKEVLMALHPKTDLSRFYE